MCQRMWFKCGLQRDARHLFEDRSSSTRFSVSAFMRQVPTILGNKRSYNISLSELFSIRLRSYSKVQKAICHLLF
jgi:hypothetical protein